MTHDDVKRRLSTLLSEYQGELSEWEQRFANNVATRGGKLTEGQYDKARDIIDRFNENIF